MLKLNKKQIFLKAQIIILMDALKSGPILTALVFFELIVDSSIPTRIFRISIALCSRFSPGSIMTTIRCIARQSSSKTVVEVIPISKDELICIVNNNPNMKYSWKLMLDNFFRSFSRVQTHMRDSSSYIMEYQQKDLEAQC